MKIARGKLMKNLPAREFRKRVELGGRKSAFVRVRDGAGNWSKWRQATIYKVAGGLPFRCGWSGAQRVEPSGGAIGADREPDRGVPGLAVRTMDSRAAGGSVGAHPAAWRGSTLGVVVVEGLETSGHARQPMAEVGAYVRLGS